MTLTVEDASGNSSTSNATVTITTAPSTLWSEDFENDALASLCGAGTVNAADNNFSVECATTDYAGPVSYLSSNQFAFTNAEQTAFISPVVDISGYIVDISIGIDGTSNLDNNGGQADDLMVYTQVDGGGYDIRATRTDENDLADFTLANITGGTLQIKIVADNGSGESYYLDNLIIQGCVDADGDGICDPVDDCVDFPAGNCGCTQRAACNFAPAAGDDDGSCLYPGDECQAAVGSDYYFYSATCGCGTASTWNQLWFEDFLAGASIADGTPAAIANDMGYLGATDTDNILSSGINEWSVSFDDATVNNGNLSDGTEPTNFCTKSYSGGNGTEFDAYQLQGIEARWTTENIDVSSYGKVFVQGTWSADGTIGASDHSKVYLIEDGVVPAAASDSVVAAISGGAWPSFAPFSVVKTTTASTVAVRMALKNTTSYRSFDDIEVSGWGVKGCMSPDASNYNALAEVDDGSCTFALAYSRYSGGFSSTIWAGSDCADNSCLDQEYVEMRAVDVLSADASTNLNFRVTSGTTVTVDGTQFNAETGRMDLYVRDLWVEDGGLINLPAGYELKVMGTFTAEDSDPFTGTGMACFLGDFTIPDGEGAPDSVGLGNVDFPASSSLTLPNGKVVTVSGNVAFEAVPPLSVTGKIVMNGTGPQSISGAGATFDELEIANTNVNGVSLLDNVRIKARMAIKENANFDAGTSYIRFSSDGNSNALLDPVPASATFIGSSGARAANQSQATAVRAEVERYIAPDDDGTTYWGYTLYGSPVNNATVSDLNTSEDFYTSGWPGSAYPNSSSTVLFWNEVTGQIESPASENESISDRGCWVMAYGSQSPTMIAIGGLNDHKIGGVAKDFTVTRQGPSAEFEGWNLVFNPYQAILDWDAVIDASSGNNAVVEDQFAVYDTQDKRFRRYGKSTAGVTWSNAQEAGEDSLAMRYINPGQGFWVRVKDGVSSGTLSLDPTMVDNDATAVGFIRNAEEGTANVLVEFENAYGATRMFLEFSENGSIEEYRDGDMSFIRSTSIRSGEGAFIVGDQKYVAKRLPLEAFDGELFIESKANFATTMRVVETNGQMPVCAHIVDHVTGEVLVLQEGEELNFTLEGDVAEAGRFTLHSVPFGAVEGLAPDCPDSEEGMILLELGEAVADLTVTDYNTMEIAATLYQQTGMVELPIAPGEYAVMMNADEESSLCRGGRRQVVVAPGEQPELLGVNPMPSECNQGAASLAFELYGSGDYHTELMQGNASIWSETLAAGEHLLEDIVPGEYMLKVDHTCLQDFEWVSLWDDDVPSVALEYSGFVQAEANGGAWIEAACPSCTTGEGFGYAWFLDGEEVGSDAPLAVRVEQVGTYSLELMTYGFNCDASADFEVTVGKYLTASPEGLHWLGPQGGQLGVVFSEAWAGVEYNWFDASGRLVEKGRIPSALGEVFIQTPSVRGWATLEIRGANGQLARWVGVL